MWDCGGLTGITAWAGYPILIFMMQEPTERVLGRYFVDRNGKSKEIADCCYEISLIDSLHQLLRMDSVQEQVLMLLVPRPPPKERGSRALMSLVSSEEGLGTRLI